MILSRTLQAHNFSDLRDIVSFGSEHLLRKFHTTLNLKRKIITLKLCVPVPNGGCHKLKWFSYFSFTIWGTLYLHFTLKHLNELLIILREDAIVTVQLEIGSFIPSENHVSVVHVDEVKFFIFLSFQRNWNKLNFTQKQWNTLNNVF